LVPLVKDNTSLDRSYPSGSASRRTVACKLADVLYTIAQRVGIELLRQHLTEPLQLFFAVFTICSLSSSSSQAAGSQAVCNSNDVAKHDAEYWHAGSDCQGIVESFLSLPSFVMPGSKMFLGFRPVAVKHLSLFV